MIETKSDGATIVHTVTGPIELAELAQAALRAQDGTLRCVIWDFRNSSIDPRSADEFAMLIKAGVRAMLDEMTTTKRAFVVHSGKQDSTVNAILRKAQPPWPWGIFRSLDDALDWVGD